MSTLQGYGQLKARFDALAGPQKMKLMANSAAGELKRNSPGQRTRMTANSIRVASVSATTAHITGSAVNVYLDRGTGIYGPKGRKITPLAKRALAFHSQRAGAERFGIKYRLSGTMTAASSRKYGPGADYVVVRSVKGMKGRPFIKRSLQKVGELLGIAMTQTWNDAA